MRRSESTNLEEKRLWSRFWQSASGFWNGRSAWATWVLTASLVVIVLAQLLVQYWLNYWNRDFFNALERRDANALAYEALIFVPLTSAGIALASISVWSRMTTQRKWREWLTTHLIRYWLDNDRYRRLGGVVGEHQNPEYRIAEDARVATDAPIDFAMGLLSSLLTAVTFMEVLWSVGGDFVFAAFGITIWLPAYLVIAVIVYSTAVTLLMISVGHPLIRVIQRKNQNEAELIASANVLRALGEGKTASASETQARHSLWVALRQVLERWREFCGQLMRMTVVSHGNYLLAPVIALVLCAPKYLAGSMTLGELTQAAAAFTTVQSAFNWLVDNYQRVADWRSSVNRVAALLLALDELNHVGQSVHSEQDSCAAGKLKQVR